LAVNLDVKSGKVAQAFSSGEMFRGFEVILKGRHPMDAQQITQRICGVCPISHGLASIKAQEQAYGIKPTRNGRLARNLILGTNYIQSHMVHFYQLSALDFIDITAILKYTGSDPLLTGLKSWARSQLNSKAIFPAAPFLPRYEGRLVEDTEINIGAIRHYLEALEMRAVAQEALAVYGGKAPHATALIPGGITERITASNIAKVASIVDRLRAFVETVYVPDVVAVAGAFPDYFEIGRGCGNFLAYGVFPETDGSNLLPRGRLFQGKKAEFDPAKITEDTASSKFSSPSGLHPYQGRTDPAPEKDGAYSWLKAPRYDGRPHEVGPLARVLVAYLAGNAEVKRLVDGVLTDLSLPMSSLDSVMGRHAARALECKIVADACARWVRELKDGEPAFTDFEIPASGRGAGLTEAPRGALGHWLEIENHRISNYQCVVPSTWNCSPRDEAGQPGPVETALEGTPIADAENPIEAARVVRSFDPCLACAVH
jgi:ferredoxin hydrogenase large subunit/hydrogenase large subunit